jgi:hypothetical protein
MVTIRNHVVRWGWNDIPCTTLFNLGEIQLKQAIQPVEQFLPRRIGQSTCHSWLVQVVRTLTRPLWLIKRGLVSWSVEEGNEEVERRRGIQG